ncbi:tRNA modification GTPase [Maribacter aquivivus]|uniref:tRNA modification GTPase n=1 Tax=Maribacter aquivivus TaxID=228958 RepID=UPI0024902E34|nr:tRNA modification GTPase [Maribacter aquivivus]
MKKYLSVFLLTFLSFNTFAQITFEPGYIIDNSGEKINCLIKNNGWKNNPTKFEYKTDSNAEVQEGGIYNIAEFSIENGKKYVRKEIKIDRSKSILKRLSKIKDAEFTLEILFLEQLIEGDANLFYYEDSNLVRFFYNLNNAPTTQLVYKKYLTENNRIGENTEYKKQLWDDLKCGNSSLNDVKSTDYKKSELLSFFTSYNQCKNPSYISSTTSQRDNKDVFNLGIRAGLNSASMDFKSPQSSTNFELENNSSIRFGVELEAVLPFNKNKWSLFIQPMYQTFEGEKQLEFQKVSVDYKSIETSIGIRHYFFLNSDSKIFLNSAFQIDTALDSKIDFESSSDFEIEPRTSFNFGLGFAHKNASIKLNYNPRRALLSNYSAISSDYKVLSIVLGYNFF